jgi:hypothetical protein
MEKITFITVPESVSKEEGVLVVFASPTKQSAFFKWYMHFYGTSSIDFGCFILITNYVTDEMIS